MTLQPLETGKSLLVLRFQCHPAIGYRFSNATITWKFYSPILNPAAKTEEPRVTLHAPRKSYGALSTVRNRTLWALKFPIQFGQVASAGVEPSVERETETNAEHAFTIIGTARGAPIKKYCVWTMEENRDSESGIPSEFQLAVVLEHNGAFITAVDVKTEVRGGLIPLVHLRSKPSSLVSIDVPMWKGKLVEWKFDRGWKEFVERMTGEVAESLMNFEQPLPRP